MTTATETTSAATPLLAIAPVGPTVDFVLDGAITAEAPIHVSSADARDIDKGVVVIPTIRGAGVVELPAIKGETFKGNVRAHATKLAIDIVRARTGDVRMPFDLPWFYRLDIGGVKGSDKQKNEDIMLLAATRRRNPIVELFGCAEPYWAPGAIEFGHAVANDIEAAGRIHGGARRDKMRSEPNLLSEFSEADQSGWLSYSEANAAAAGVKREIKAIENEIKKKRGDKSEAAKAEIGKLRDKIAEMKKEVKETKAGEIVGETVGRPLDAKKAILPGAMLTQKIRGNRVSLPAFGFFLKTLETMEDNPRIGGHASRGFGAFSAQWHLRARINPAVGRAPWSDAGTVILRDADFVMPDSAIVRDAIAAFDALCKDDAVDFGYAV